MARLMSEQSVAEWLRGMATVQDASPITLQIGRTTYHGAKYTAIGTYTAGMMAVQDGRKQDGETYTEERYYLLGSLPASARRPIAYRMAGDDRDWYIGGWYQTEPVAPEHAEYHPFGRNFSLHVWDVPNGERIDRYDRTPRRRMAITLNGNE